MKPTTVFATVVLCAFSMAIWAADAPKEAPEEAPPYYPGPDVPEVTSMLQMDVALTASKSAPLLVFKHSTACPISAGAAQRLNRYVEASGEEAPRIVYVKVIESSPISRAFEKRLAVKHESPQIILVRDGKAVWSTSHEAITGEAIAKALKDHAETKKNS